MINQELAKQAGLVQQGKDFEGNDEYIGTNKQWDEYKELEEREIQELIDEKINQDFQEDMRSEIEDDDEMTLGSMDRF